MTSARRYRPTSTRLFTWILRHTYGAFITSRYKARAIGLEVFDTVKPPFILVGNHSTLLDPFITNYFVPYPVHWVSSDGNMRSAIMRFLLIKLVGSIPKSKAIPDIETVNWIVEFIRKRKSVVGFYPEGQSTWDGSSLPSLVSTAKLVKLLKAPVICAVSRGAYMTKPRWAYTRRDGEMQIEYSQLLTPQRIKELSVEEIDTILNAAIQHDDPAWAQRQGLEFQDPKRAECLELALYACPACGKLQTLKSAGERVVCLSCGFTAEYEEKGSFKLEKAGSSLSPALSGMESRGGSLLFPSLRGWDHWQKAHLEALLKANFAASPDSPIFFDEGVRLLRGKRMDRMEYLGHGRLSLNSKSISLKPAEGEDVSIDLAEIDGPGVLKWNFFEFYVGKAVYRARFDDRAASGYKYASAIEILATARQALSPASSPTLTP